MDKMTREPCDFVKLVLQRMDSNPEEFEHYGRWNTLCESLERIATQEYTTPAAHQRNVLWAYDQFEIDLMLAKYREIYRDLEYKSMLKNLLMGNEQKPGGLIRDAKLGYQGITPQQLFADTGTIGVAVGHTGVTIANTASSTTSNPQIRSMIDDAIEARMQGFKRG